MKLYPHIKQIVDRILALCLAVFLSPLLLLICIIIKLDSEGPVLFKQKRVGKDGANFEIYKFRTMKTSAPKETPTHLFEKPESYITKSGRTLRKTSLDELPQLLNILKGDMSFIGPRPALWNQYDLLQAREDQKKKTGISANSIKPGVTGWAQVNGRDELPIDVKADFDGFYAKNISFSFDIRIFFMTIFSVLMRKGVSEGGPKGR